MKLALAVTAAGLAKRFGNDKLSLPYQDSSIGAVCLSLYADLPFCAKVAVLSSQKEYLQAAAERYGYTCVINTDPAEGISSSVRLALNRLLIDCNPDGILFATADMPFLRKESISRLLDLFGSVPESICSLAHGTVWGKPVIFPRRFFHDLSMLTGDTGGKYIIRQNISQLKTVEVSPEELIDIDTPEDAHKWLNN